MLGGFSVSVGARTIEEGEWCLKKAAHLVKVIALAPRHRMHREGAMDLLWPDLRKGAASNNLRRTLHAARRILSPAGGFRYLASEDESLVLCPEGRLWVDVEAFAKSAATAKRTREPAAYWVALELYAGNLLPGDRYEAWAEEQREALRRTYLSLLLELGALYEERGELGPAIETLRKVVADEPTNEVAHMGLMRLHVLSCQPGEAISQYERLREALSGQLGMEPSAAIQRLRDEIVAGKCPSPLTSPVGLSQEEALTGGKHNLPSPRTTFVGREHELTKVKRELAITRLLTLTGAGGSGKTRLALEVARELAGAYPDGTWLIELAPLSEGELVPQVMATTLKVREQPSRSLTDTLTEALREKETLLVVDNCEHLMDSVTLLLGTLLDSCPRLRVLATSREALNVTGESVWRVSSLSMPDTNRLAATGELTSYDAVRLFLDRARLRLPGFGLTPVNAGAIAEICCKLEGIPLAIELTTARMATLSVRQISEKLQDPLGLLSIGERTAVPRQQTLRGTLNWSYELLSESEQVLFGVLSVFAGGWTLEAAEAVCPGEILEEGEVLDLLGGLVDKSMVVTEEGADERARYRMLEPVRQYAREKLEESRETNAVRRRHADFFLTLAEEAEPRLRGSEQEEWLGQLEIEHDNLRSALSWTSERGETELALRLAGALGEFWHIRGYLSEGRRWLQAALERESTPEEPRVRALARAGYLAWETSDYERATALSEEALSLARELEDTTGEAAALYNLGAVATLEVRLEEASASLGEATELLRTLGDEVSLARALQGLGLVEVARHNFERAVALYDEGLPLARRSEDNLALALMLGMGALAFLGLGDHRQVRDLCAEAMDLSQRLGHLHTIAFILHVLASLAGAQGQPVRAARLWGAAEALREAIEIQDLAPVERRHYGTYIHAARDQLDEAAWKRAWAEGRAMTPEQAAAYGLPAEEPSLSLPFARIKALAKAGWIAWEQGEFERSMALSREGLALSRSLGDEAGAAASLYNMGMAELFQEEHERARVLFEEAAELQRKRGDKAGLARGLQGLGMVVRRL